MINMKMNKIAVACLLMTLVVGFGQAVPEQPPLENHIEGEMHIVGDYPKLGEIFDVIYRIKIKETEDWTLIESYLRKDYFAVVRCIPSEAAEIIGKDRFFFSGLTPGECKEFRARCRILKPVNKIYINGDIDLAVQGKSRGPVATGGGVDLFLIDSKTGQYGTNKEWLERALNVFWKYNNVEPQWLSEPRQGWEASNRKIAEEMRNFEPTLTDSEALCLHEDNYKLIINAIGAPKATDDERIEHLLKAGWLEAQRSGAEAKEQWSNNFMEKNRGNWGGNSINFFRADNSTDRYHHGSDSSSKERITTTFIGTWNYQDHLYDRDNGLLWSYTVKPVKTAEVSIRAYWIGQGAIFVGWGMTDANGSFTIQTELIPHDAASVKAYPVLYTWGPERYNEKIIVTAPDAFVSSWRNPRDYTVWFLGRPFGTPADNVTPGGTCDFGVCYPETAIVGSIRQPRSGAVNILETCLHARTFMSPPPSWPLRVVWEPGSNVGTYYRDDTIRVIGDTVGPIRDTDEWDDDVLLHEFGHYLMDNYAEIPPDINQAHHWYTTDTIYPNTAYCEGWANFFSGRARVGSGADSLFVNNRDIGSEAPLLWRNLENPWLGSGFDTTGFAGGEYCEGAVAGVLWDIYDPYDEISYHSYPWDGFPDTALADSLTMGFEPIWDVFDNYDPTGAPANCWTILHFRSGWDEFDYDHDFALNQIFLHHRIPDSIPAAPTGLEATLDEDYYVRLYWNRNSEPDLEGYRIYRGEESTLIQWSDWVVLVEVSDTTYLDTTVEGRHTYRYKVSAFDSLGNASEPSDSVQIDVPATFIRGDANNSTDLSMADALYILEYIYVPGTPVPECMDAVDVNDDGNHAISDALYLMQYLYVPSSPPPPPPCCAYPDNCGPDPTLDSLDCQNHPCQGTKISTGEPEVDGEMILGDAIIQDQEVIVPVYLQNNCSLLGFSYTISYDPTVLSFRSADNTDLLTEGFDFFSANSDEENGSVSVGSVVNLELKKNLAPGYHEVAHLIFEIKTDKLEETVLEFSDAELVDTEATPMTTRTNTCTIKVLFSTPRVFALGEAFPNPFTGGTSIRYQLPKESRIALRIYNSAGQLVNTLVDEQQNPGFYRVEWDGKDVADMKVASGVYFYRIEMSDYTATKKMILLK